MSGSGKNHFGVCIPDLQKRTAFALEGVRRCNIVAYLNINFFGYLQKRVVLKLSSGFRPFGDFIILGDFLFKKRWFPFLLQGKLDGGCHSKLGGFLFENGWYFQS